MARADPAGFETITRWSIRTTAGHFTTPLSGGQITGKGLDLGVVDDPVKGRAEATSKTVRDKLWQWFTDDFLTRFSDSAGLLMIMTRWHLDDPVERLIERFPAVTFVVCDVRRGQWSALDR